jgi:hypothetical protein
MIQKRNNKISEVVDRLTNSYIHYFNRQDKFEADFHLFHSFLDLLLACDKKLQTEKQNNVFNVTMPIAKHFYTIVTDDVIAWQLMVISLCPNVIHLKA